MIEKPSRFAIVASAKARPRPITTMAMSDDPCDMPFGYLEDWRPAFAVRRSSRARVTAAATKVRLMRTNRIGLSFAIISKRRSIGFAQHVAGNDQLLDLARAFVEPEQPDVAVEALDAEIGDVARAAMDLHRAVGDPAHHLAGEILAAGGLGRDALAGILPPCRVEHHRARGIGLGAAVGEHRLDQLELADGLAELHPFLGVADHVADEPLGDADAAAMWMRPRSSTFIAVLKPCPSRPPSSAAAGTRQSSKMTSQVWAPRCPILRSGGPSLRPGLGASTRKAEMPPAPLFSGSVRAITVNRDASGALVMKRLVPFSTQPFPAHRAVVLRLAASEPALGSVKAKEAMTSPAASRGRYLRLCSSVPSLTMPWLPMPLLVPRTERKAGEG